MLLDEDTHKITTGFSVKDRKHRLKFKQDKHKGSHFFFFLSFFYFKENQSQKVEGEKKSDPTKYM